MEGHDADMRDLAHSSASEYLANTEFTPDVAEERFPNARRQLEKGLFVSHAGRDLERIRQDLMPVIYERFAPERFFLHSRGSGGADSYVQLVQAALHYCDKFMVVVSQYSVDHEWVAAEVGWAVRRERPILSCLFDDSDPGKINPALVRPPVGPDGKSTVNTVDFRCAVRQAQSSLERILDRLLAGGSDVASI
jgi:hypothetical protein